MFINIFIAAEQAVSSVCLIKVAQMELALSFTGKVFADKTISIE